ncbi:LmbU family transcriptional regulator [Micromonospora arida]|uniref:LmbU family transcriptional regulator n=1 Tax=Micromonospora arida TaxID=2203715 RepID=UPI003CEA6E01
MRSRDAQVLTTKVALRLPARLGYEEWEHAGRQLGGVLSSSAWWLGDWMNYGKEHYSDRYVRGSKAVGLRYQTLRNYAWVAGRFPPSRRHASLSFHHHAELASLDVDEQDQWLQRAQRSGWTVKQLRAAMRQDRRDANERGAHEDNVRRVAVPSERFQRWFEAATQMGIGVEDWMVDTLDNAAEQILTT